MDKLTTKLTIVIFTLALLFFVQPSNTLAVEGTCSWHGGVNCSAGPDWDGSTICKDGWRDSSERYSATLECEDTLHYCKAEEITQLDLKYGVQEKKKIADDIWAQLKPYIDKSLSGSLSQDDILIDLDLNAKFIVANNHLQFAIYQANKECYALGETEFYQAQADFLKQLQSLQTQTQNIPQYTCPANSTLNASNTCSCNSGYSNDNGQCVSTDDYCKLTYGVNSLANTTNGAGRCICDTGYAWNSTGTSCNKIEVQSIPQPSPAPVKPPEIKPTFLQNVIPLKKQATSSIKESKNIVNEATTTPQVITPQVQKDLSSQKAHTFWQKVASPFKNFWRWLFK